MKKVLAIDFGTKRIGIAVNRATLAEPLEILPHDDQVFSRLKAIIDEERIELLVVGISERTMAEQTRDFARVLKEKFKLPIEFVDETGSSVLIHEKLAHGPMKLSRRQQPIDHYAAAELLQEWLDTNDSF